MTDTKRLDILISLIEKHSTLRLAARTTLGGANIEGKKRYAVSSWGTRATRIAEGNDIRKILDEIGSQK